MISLLGIASDRRSQILFKGHFYFSFGGIINNIVKFDLLHCMLFVSLTVSFGFTSKLIYFQICLCLVKRYLLEISNVTPS